MTTIGDLMRQSRWSDCFLAAASFLDFSCYWILTGRFYSPDDLSPLSYFLMMELAWMWVLHWDLTSVHVVLACPSCHLTAKLDQKPTSYVICC